MPDLLNPVAVGNTKEIQYNSSGSMSSEAGFEYDSTTDTLSVKGVVASEKIVFSAVDADTTSSKTNDWTPSGWAADTGYETRWNGTTSIGITGLTNGVAGREWQLTNATTNYMIWLENQNTSSTAANRFILPKGLPVFLLPDDTVILRYDGTSSRWRLKTWNRQGKMMGLDYFTDCFTVPTSTAPISDFEYVTSATGTQASVQQGTYLQNTTEKPLGVLQFDTGNTNAGRAGFGVGEVNFNQLICALGCALTISRIAIETTTSSAETFSVMTGFGEPNAATPTDGVTWENRWNGSAAEWAQTRWLAASATRTTTGSPSVDNNYIVLVIFLNSDWTRADFIYSTDSISFTLASSPTTGLPTSSTLTSPLPFVVVKTVGTTLRAGDLDYYGWRYDYIRG